MSLAGALNCTIDSDCGFVDCGGDPLLDPAWCNDNGQCTCSKRASFFVGVGIYIGVVLFIALYSAGQSTNIHPGGGHPGPGEVGIVDAGVSKLKDHFMASGAFGSVVMALTIYSTAFSGYTVVGVPQEASEVGFVALRWLAIGVAVNLGCLVFYPRLRRIGVTRNYNAPTDLIVDRFNSNRLRLLSSFVLVIPLFIYTTVQFKAMADIIEGLSLGRIPKTYSVWMLCAVIIFCEIVGGQRSVTLSDSIQAAIMLVAFMTMPFVVMHSYGALADIIEPDCPNSYLTHEGFPTGCLAYTRPWGLLTPTVSGTCDYSDRFNDPNCLASHYPGAVNASGLPYLDKAVVGQVINPDTKQEFQHVTLSLATFVFNAVAFPLNPHVMQKVFVARSDEVLKRSLMMVALGALLTTLPSFYYGIVKASALNKATASAFPVVTGELIDQGGFAELIAVVASCSALAAIMSTTDSCIIGANNVITVDWVKNHLWKSASDKEIQRFSKVFTPVFAIGALLFSFNLDGINFGTLLNLQNSFVWQVVPTFFAACYTDRVAAHPLLYGQITGLTFCLVLEIIVAAEGLDEHNRNNLDTIIPSGLWAVMVNIGVVYVAQTVLSAVGSQSASDDTRQTDTVDPNVMREFGPHRLTVAFVETDIIPGTTEPLKIRRNLYIVGAVVGLFVVSLPWYHSPYAAQNIVAGIPQWAGGFLTSYVIQMVLVTYLLWTWKTDPAADGNGAADAHNPEADNRVSDAHLEPMAEHDADTNSMEVKLVNAAT